MIKNENFACRTLILCVADFHLYRYVLYAYMLNVTCLSSVWIILKWSFFFPFFSGYTSYNWAYFTHLLHISEIVSEDTIISVISGDFYSENSISIEMIFIILQNSILFEKWVLMISIYVAQSKISCMKLLMFHLMVVVCFILFLLFYVRQYFILTRSEKPVLWIWDQ